MNWFAVARVAHPYTIAQCRQIAKSLDTFGRCLALAASYAVVERRAFEIAWQVRGAIA